MSLIPKRKTSYPVPPFNEITIMIYGAPGAGKTRFCAGDPNTLFIATEPGQQFTTASVVYCWEWPTFTSVIDEIISKRQAIRNGQMPLEECPYTSFTIDIVDNLAAQCRDYVCKRKGLA